MELLCEDEELQWAQDSNPTERMHSQQIVISSDYQVCPPIDRQIQEFVIILVAAFFDYRDNRDKFRHFTIGDEELRARGMRNQTVKLRPAKDLFCIACGCFGHQQVANP